MSSKWIWISVAGVCFFLFLLTAAVLVTVLLSGEERKFIVGSGVGLVEVKGLIIDSQETVRQLNDFRKDDRVKAVVLRIDSPGGVVGPSQELYAEVRKLAARKRWWCPWVAWQPPEGITLPPRPL